MNSASILTIGASVILVISIVAVLYLTRKSFRANEDFERTGHKIFYQRDNAGYNNLRLQFETMVAVAGITKRTLVIPSASNMAHTDEEYHDLDIFNGEILGQHIHWVNAKDTEPMEEGSVHKLDKQIAKVDLRSLPRDKDWFFDSSNSRIQHFECLSLTDKDLKKAENFILEGLEFTERMRNLFDRTMAEMPETFNSVHVRYIPDFDKGNGGPAMDQDHLNSADSISKKIKEHTDSGTPLYVSTNGSKSFLKDLEAKISQKVFSHFDHPVQMSQIESIIVDMLISSRGKLFLGHPHSTFSTGIIQLRRKHKILDGQADLKFVSITDKSPFIEGGTIGEQCWTRVTEFKHHSYEPFDILAR